MLPVILFVSLFEGALMVARPSWILNKTRSSSSHGLIYSTCVLPGIIQFTTYPTFTSHSIVICALCLTSVYIYHSYWSPRIFLISLLIHLFCPVCGTLTIACLTCCGTLLNIFPRNFSLGEALLISNAFGVILNSIRIVSSSETVTILAFLFVGILVTATVVTPISAHLRDLSKLHKLLISPYYNNPSRSDFPLPSDLSGSSTTFSAFPSELHPKNIKFRNLSILDDARRGWVTCFYITIAFMIFGIITPIVTARSGANPWSWVYFFITTNKLHMWLIAYWLSLIVLSIFFFPKRRSLNLKRKFFHFLATASILPGYLFAPVFTCLAMDVTFSVFILMELIRVGRVPPFGDALHEQLAIFCDQRDEGMILTSHIYLLLGIASPIWLGALERKWVIGISGIATLGIGDTFASIVGSSFGRHRWFQSQKTVEGSLGFFFSSLFVYLILGEALSINLILSVLLTAIIEAVSTQFDNLFIPLVMLFATL
ncbi:hypothetical protein HMI54_009702 [Coelomomyces lativittatus]|nr:hypothetical protein HMI54_009702 [Coelomomyces lativittatus]